MNPLVSICIPCYNQRNFLPESIKSCLMQDYKNIEIIVLDDASNVGTLEFPELLNPKISLFRSEFPSGTGGSFNKAISHATGDIILLLCADDLFTNPKVVSDIVLSFNLHRETDHISRYYYQFIDGDSRPVRSWHGNNILELANNPSGLAFRSSAIKNFKLSNKMFVEVSSFVSEIFSGNNRAMIIPWHTVAVRIHQSISRDKNYYLKRWVSSPVEEWAKIGGTSLLKDYTSLIQIKTYFTMEAVLRECFNFVKYRPINIITPTFLFFALIAIFTPRFILIHIPHWYRITIGRWTTREIKRP